MKIIAKQNGLNAMINACEREMRITDKNIELSDIKDIVFSYQLDTEKLEELDIELKTMFDVGEKELLMSKVYYFLKYVFEEEQLEIDSQQIKNILKNYESVESKKYKENEYLKLMKFNNEKYKDFILTTETFEKFELVDLGEAEIKKGLEYPKWGILDDECDFLYLQKSNENMIRITPNEIANYQEHIDKVEGNVLVLSSVLGYFSYMIGLKKEVKSITIIEDDKNQFEMFKKCILPKFEDEVKNKIQILNSDYLKYLKSINDAEYDYCLVDLYKGQSELPVYYDIKKLHNKFKKMKMLYNNENTFLGNTKEYTILYLNYTLHQRLGNESKTEKFSEHFKKDLRQIDLEFIEYLLDGYKLKELKDAENLFNLKFILNKLNSIKLEENN